MPTVVLRVRLGAEDIGDLLLGSWGDRLVGFELGDGRLARGGVTLGRRGLGVSRHHNPSVDDILSVGVGGMRQG